MDLYPAIEYKLELVSDKHVSHKPKTLELVRFLKFSKYSVNRTGRRLILPWCMLRKSSLSNL